MSRKNITSRSWIWYYTQVYINPVYTKSISWSKNVCVQSWLTSAKNHIWNIRPNVRNFISFRPLTYFFNTTIDPHGFQSINSGHFSAMFHMPFLCFRLQSTVCSSRPPNMHFLRASTHSLILILFMPAQVKDTLDLCDWVLWNYLCVTEYTTLYMRSIHIRISGRVFLT